MAAVMIKCLRLFRVSIYVVHLEQYNFLLIDPIPEFFDFITWSIHVKYKQSVK